MDLYTANAAQSMHADQARRAARELEHRRVAAERAAETAGAITTEPRAPRTRRAFTLGAVFHSRARAAQ